MFKIGVITDAISRDVEKAVNVAKELGMDCVELRKCWNKNVKDLTDAEVRKIRRIIESAGLEVTCIASPFFKCNIDKEAEVQEHLNFLPRLVEIAELFDTEIIRGFAFWSTVNKGQFWNEMVKKMREAAEICLDEGVILALENEHTTLIGTGKEVRFVVEAVNSRGLKVVWDPANAMCAGEVPYPDGYLQVQDHIVHVHLKDTVRTKESEKPKFIAIGQGEIDYEGQFKALVEDGYTGSLSLEPHYRIQNDREKSTRETYAELKRLLKKIKLE